MSSSTERAAARRTGRKKIAVVTSSRADFSIQLPVARELARSADVGWIASGTHLSREFGRTVDEVEASGIPIWETVRFILSDDSDESLVLSDGMALAGYGQALARIRPNMVLLLGDRWEIHACATAATLLRLPVAHIHGGEETEGAIDNVLRHSITKLAQLHFAATDLSGRRIRQMGEAAERIVVSGSPSLDKLRSLKYLGRAEFARRYGAPAAPFLLVTYHAVTTDLAATEKGLRALLSVLRERKLPTLFTYSNADSYGRTINEAIDAFCRDNPFATAARSLGGEGYANAMKHASAMVGNSSSGIIEAAHFGLPVVNIGDRQRGRERSGNTIEAVETRASIAAALDEALSDDFRAACRGLPNVYGDGKAAPRVARALLAYLRGTPTVAKPFALMD
ncbi:MAG: UDP-N-acetylglucosamine 2-epimerase (hydrolyzing) [Rhizobiaceae bacterium]|nr:UDP-N-acetylglucosamine 2-epimerase (hydrolyzing) [Rhizobiaceae bacterium]